MGAEVRRSVYEIKLRRFEARILGLGMFGFDAGPGAGIEGLLRGDALMIDGVASLGIDRGEPPIAEADGSIVTCPFGGDALRAGLGALELLNGLANPDWKPDAEAAPLTEALALTSPLIPIPWRRRDIVGGEGLPAEVPVPDPIGCGWLNCALSGDGWDCSERGDCTAEPPRLWANGCAGIGLRTVIFAPVSSTALRAETAESSTLGTVSSSASVVLDRGIRCGLTLGVGLPVFVEDRRGLEAVGAACRGTESDGRPRGSISRSKIAELDECMLVGELGMLLGLRVPSREFPPPPGERLNAAGANPDGSPARWCEPAPAFVDVVVLSGLVACLEGFVGVAFGTLRVAEGEDESWICDDGDVGAAALVPTLAVDGFADGDGLEEGRLSDGDATGSLDTLSVADMANGRAASKAGQEIGRAHV